jgi:hypothetical protein
MDAPAILAHVLSRPRVEGVDLNIQFDLAGMFSLEIFAHGRSSMMVSNVAERWNGLDLDERIDQLVAECGQRPRALRIADLASSVN